MSKKKFNILQILPEFNSGGVERGTLEIAEGLIANGHSAFIVSNGGKMVQKLEEIGGTHIKLGVHRKNPIKIIINIFELKKVIIRHDIDLIHVRSRAPAWSAYFASKLTKKPLVTTFHGAYKAQNPIKRFYNSIMLRSDKVIAVSNFIKKHIETRYHFKSDSLLVIPRGVDLDYFNPAKVTKQRINAMLKEIEVPKNGKIILLPARMTRLKGHAFLLNALKYIRNLDFTCIMVGKMDEKHQDLKRELEIMIRDHGLQGKVFIRDAVSDMPALYSIADVVISTSIEPEAFGRTITEAQAMGKVVIATKLGAPIEVIDDGITGYLVSPNKPSDFANMIKKVFELDSKALDKITIAALKKVNEEYSLTKMCEATITVYKSLL